VLAVGEPAAVDALVAWLWRGPPAAHVQDVQCADVALGDLGELPGGFNAR
jgi:acylphosphatase